MSFGGGTACNFLDKEIITSRDGSVLEKLDNLNLLCRIRQLYENDFEHNQTVLSAAGGKYNGTSEAKTSSVFIQPGQTVRVLVSMRLVSPLFDS